MRAVKVSWSHLDSKSKSRAREGPWNPKEEEVSLGWVEDAYTLAQHGRAWIEEMLSMQTLKQQAQASA